jgi:hypothetical protein
MTDQITAGANFSPTTTRCPECGGANMWHAVGCKIGADEWLAFTDAHRDHPAIRAALGMPVERNTNAG